MSSPPSSLASTVNRKEPRNGGTGDISMTPEASSSAASSKLPHGKVAAILDASGGGSFVGNNPTPTPEEENKDMVGTTTKVEQVPFRKLFRFAEPTDWLLMFVGALGGSANGASLSGFSVIFGQLFDALNSTDPSGATSIALLFVYVGCGAFVASTLQVACFTMASERMTIRLRRAYMNSILDQEMGFFDEQNAGTITSRVAEAALLYREALGEKFGALFQFGAMFVAGIIVGFTFSWKLTLLILSITPFLAASGYFMNSGLNKLVSGQLQVYAAAGAIAEETFSLIRIVTSFGMQERQVEKFNDELVKSGYQAKKQGVTLGLGFGSTMGIYFASYALTFYVGAVLIANSKTDAQAAYPLVPSGYCQVGALVPANCTTQQDQVGVLTFASAPDVCACPGCNCGCYYNVTGDFASNSRCMQGGDVILTFFAVLIGSFGIGQAAPSITALSKGRVAAAKLYAVIDRKPRITDEAAKPEYADKPLKGDVVFKDVDFAYPSRPNYPVFNKLNLTIPFGKRVGLCGQSGSGKSTVIGLLERYYDPTGGSVLIGGVDIRHVTLAKLRSSIALVSQNPILFATTIEENIRYGRPDATPEEIRKVGGWLSETPRGGNSLAYTR